jgi:hypothetical protein
MRNWGARHWTVAALSTLVAAAFLAGPTALLPNPWFVRQIPTPTWAYPVLVAVAVLSGLVAATYVRGPDGPGGRRASAGALLGFLAVGCPVCNKLVVLVLGYTGAMTSFAPMQPLLAVLAVGGLAAALRSRLRNAAACAVPRARDDATDSPPSPGAVTLAVAAGDASPRGGAGADQDDPGEGDHGAAAHCSSG